MIERLRRLPEAARALWAAGGLKIHEDWGVERLRSYQQERLLLILRYASTHSPYYRERFAGIELSDDLDLAALPRLDKATMLEHFDELVTDRRITLARVERHMAELEGADSRIDPLLLREYRAMASGGTSGRRGVFIYGRDDWREALGGLFRCFDAYLGFGPRLPRRRLTTIVADHPLHISGRFNRSTDIGGHRFLRLDARAPVGDLVEALNDFQPQGLVAYPSIAAMLAQQQLAGGLRIGPPVVATIGEVCTMETKERMVEAWGRAPFDLYGTSETGHLAAECERHAGLHVFEDQVLIEVLDDEYRPVPAGEPGSRLLVTNLFNRTQPLIRYELNDLLTVSPRACPCGRPFPLLESVGGRSDDILELPAGSGGKVKVHPLTLRSPLAKIAALSEYRVVYGAGELRVEAVLTGADGQQACREIETRLKSALAERAVRVPPIRVESVAEIPRHPRSGKHKAIEVRGESGK